MMKVLLPHSVPQSKKVEHSVIKYISQPGESIKYLCELLAAVLKKSRRERIHMIKRGSTFLDSKCRWALENRKTYNRFFR